jgi:hypothetical protein
MITRDAINTGLYASPTMVILDRFYHITNTGDIKARETRTFERTKDGACAVVFGFGVDDETEECTGATLGLTAMVGRTTSPFDLFEDGPRSKRVRVAIGDGPRGARFTVEIKYTWPGGFRRLLTKDMDHGEFVIRSRGTERCTVTMELEDGYHRQLKPLDVFYVGRPHERTEGNGLRQSFSINHPRANSRIFWTATMLR